jgi:hypothetical protein
MIYIAMSEIRCQGTLHTKSQLPHSCTTYGSSEAEILTMGLFDYDCTRSPTTYEPISSIRSDDRLTNDEFSLPQPCRIVAHPHLSTSYQVPDLLLRTHRYKSH